MSWFTALNNHCGLMHAREGVPCQDAAKVQVLPGDVLVGVIADGAGSASRAAEGARIVVREGLAYLEKIAHHRASHKDFEDIALKVQRALRSHADKVKCSISHFASTFIAFIATPSSIKAVQVGDGFLVISGAQGGYELLVEPLQKAHANETDFITDTNLDGKILCGARKYRPNFIAGSTDGLENVAIIYQNQTPHEGFFRPFEQFIRTETDVSLAEQEIQKFLSSERLAQRSSDDKTLLLCGWQENEGKSRKVG